MKFQLSFLKIAFLGAFLITSSPTFAQTTLQQHNEAVTLNNQAISLVGEGRLTEALELFNNSLSIEEDYLVFYNRAMTLSKLKRYDEALKDVNRLMLQNAENVKVLSLRARIYYAQNKNVAAFNDLTKLLSLEPENAEFAIRRGQAAIESEKFIPALDSYYYAEALLQQQSAIAPDLANRRKEIPKYLAAIYRALGLPISSFMGNNGTSTRRPEFEAGFKPKPDELRFDGICSAIDLKTGKLSFDTLAVSFPNGKAKVLAQPKSKLAQIAGVKPQNGYKADFSGQIKVGDFVVLVGKDNGKIIAARAIALGVISPEMGD